MILKTQIRDKLRSLGWTPDPNNPERMVPPKSLFETRPESYSIWDAQDIQELLSQVELADISLG